MADTWTETAMELVVNKALSLMAATASFVLGACEVQTQSQAEPVAAAPATTATVTTPTPTGNRYNDQLLAMRELDRSDVFKKLLRASGERCPTVRKTLYQGMERQSGQAFWNVDCGSKDWIVSIDGQSSTRILECSVAARLGTTKCWTLFN